MDRVLRLHVEHHTAARLGEGGVDASRPDLVLASLALFLAAAGSGSLLTTTKAALFVLSNAIILALLAADCRCFFFATAGASTASDAIVVDACEEESASGHVLDKQGRHHQQCAVQPCVPCAGYLLQHENKNSCAGSEASTEAAIASDGTTTLEALEEQEDVPPASTPEHLLELPEPDQGESIAMELEAPLVQERTCKTESGLDELGIDELNKKFDEFIQSKWMEAAY